MTAMNTVSRRAALATVVLAALAAVDASAAKSEYKPKFTWWAILIMMIGIVVVITVALVIYFCACRKEQPEENEKHADNEKDVHSEGSAAVPPANDSANREPASKEYPVEEKAK